MTNPHDDAPADPTAAALPADAIAIPALIGAGAGANVEDLETATLPPAESLTRRARDGAIWAAGGTVVMLGSTLLAQIVVGNILKTEYALNMLIVSVTMVAGLLRDAGIRKIAVAAGDDFPNVARQLQQLSWILNVTVGVICFLAAPLLAQHYFNEPHPELRRMLWVLAFTFAVSPAWMMQWAKLTIDLRFRTITILTLGSYLTRNVSLILLAVFGYKQMALVLPALISSTFESIGGRVCGGTLPPGPRLTWRTAVSSLMTSRWIMLGLIGLILTTRADTYFISRYGHFDFDTDIAWYGFASLLAFSALTPFTQTVQVTLTPIFVRLVDDPERLGRAFVRVLGVASVVASAAWLAAMFTSGPTMHLLWRGKWDSATPIVIGLLCMLIPKSLQAAALALDEARGRFRTVALLVLLDGVTTVAFALAGALRGHVVWLAAAISFHHLVFCVYHVLYVGRRACVHEPAATRALLLDILAPGLTALTALAASLGLVRLTGHAWWPGTSPVGFVWAIVSVGLYVALLRLTQPRIFQATLDLILRRGQAQ